MLDLVVIERDALRQLIAEECRRAVLSAGARDTAGTSATDDLNPDHVYTYDTAAPYLGRTRDQVKSISHKLLPRIEAGRIQGIDIMVYRCEITREEATRWRSARRGRILRQAADDGAARRPVRQRAAG